MLADAEVAGPGVTLAVLDLDQFKEVNDAFGHGVGDELLVAVAGALERCAPIGSMVARLGGDEFAVVTRLDADHTARTRRPAAPCVRAPAATGQRSDAAGRARASASRTTPPTPTPPTTLLQHADVAMYMAKRQNIGSARVRARAGSLVRPAGHPARRSPPGDR